MKCINTLLSIVILGFLSTLVFASNDPINHFEYFDPEVTVEFDEGNNFDEETKQRIADNFAGITSMGTIGEDNPENILCVLFGHNTSDSTVVVIRHKVHIYDPRCREEYYNVTACSRCDYTVDEFLGCMDIHCHPEDEIN